MSNVLVTYFQQAASQKASQRKLQVKTTMIFLKLFLRKFTLLRIWTGPIKTPVQLLK